MIHYRVNATPPTGSSLTVSQIVGSVEAAATEVMTADPQLQLVDDGTTSAQPVGFNNVVGFVGQVAGSVLISMQTDNSGHYTGFNIQLSSAATWAFAPCNATSGPCAPSPGQGYDLQGSLTHAWAHVPGLDDLGNAQTDRLMTNYGATYGGPDCGGSTGYVCRFADTLGLGEVLGIRHLYPTAAAMPAIYYDQ